MKASPGEHHGTDTVPSTSQCTAADLLALFERIVWLGSEMVSLSAAMLLDDQMATGVASDPGTTAMTIDRGDATRLSDTDTD